MLDPTTVQTEAMPGSDTTSGEIVARTSQHVEVMPLISDAEIERTWRVATALAKARMFKDIAQAEQAFAKILIGRDLGLSPTQSMQGLHVFDGNVQIAGPTLGAFIKRRRDEGYGYKVLERTHERARILFITPDGTDEDVSEFSMEDAARAGLAGKKNWKNDPRSMLFWRAMSNGVKAFCPEVMGGIPVYVEGEISDSRPAAASEGGGEAAEIPHGLLRLLERAWAIDRRAFRRNAIVARLDGTDETLEAVIAEVGQWVAQHENAAAPATPAAAPAEGEEEIPDAEVVPDAPASAAPERETSEALVEDEPNDDVWASPSDRYEGDAAWRAKVDELLHSAADLDTAVQESGWTAETRTGVGEIRGKLLALGVPEEWAPPAPPAGEEA